jgi:C4-dicarboxylate-specific signal transduction histidine kinase
MSLLAGRLVSWTDHSSNRALRLRLRLQPYGLALILVAAALVANQLLHHAYVGRPTMFPFFAAIAAAAWFGGSGPGYFAAAISAPIALYVYPASDPTPGVQLGDVAFFAFFASCAFVGGTLNTRQRQTEEVLRKAHGQLQAKAAELQSVNDALVAEMRKRRHTEATLEQTRSQLDRMARLTAMAEMAASIAHEINQPLTAVATNADTCVRWLDGARPDLTEARDAARRTAREAARAGQVVARVRAMVRKALSERAEVSVAQSLSEILVLLEPEIVRHGVVLRTNIAPDLPSLSGDRVQLQQVFVNLITNALDSLGLTAHGQRELTISASLTDDCAIEVAIADNGAGFAEGVRGRLFEPFVTTKQSGMGMGLSISRTIVEAHGGALEASPVQPHGARFRIILPLTGEISCLTTLQSSM